MSDSIRLNDPGIADLGAGGVFLGLKTLENDRTLLTQRNRLLDNHIHNGGKIFHSAIGVWIGQSPFNRLIHNHIHDLYYSGISVGWRWGYGGSNGYGNIIEWNHIHDIGKGMLSDMGGIYCLGVAHGTRLRYNLIHDIHSRTYGG